MAENTKEPLYDVLDYNIIKEIQQLGRLDAAKIARSFGANERTVRKRINRLINDEAIYLRPVVNPHAFGYTVSIIAFLKVAAEHEEDVTNHLLEMPEITFLAYGLGDCDILLQASFKSSNDMRIFLRRTLPAISSVTVTGHILVPHTVRTRSQWMPRIEDFQPIDDEKKEADVDLSE